MSNNFAEKIAQAFTALQDFLKVNRRFPVDYSAMTDNERRLADMVCEDYDVLRKARDLLAAALEIDVSPKIEPLVLSERDQAWLRKRAERLEEITEAVYQSFAVAVCPPTTSMKSPF